MMYTFKKDYATILIEKDKSLLILEWLRQPSDEEFKEAFVASLEAAKAFGIRRYLSRNALGINIDLSLQRWVATIGAEVIDELRLERYARLLPRDAMQEIISHKIYENMQRMLPNRMQFNIFNDEDAALDWLLQGEKKAVKKE